MTSEIKHPMQPVVDVDGTHRFKANAIVQWLLDAGPFDMTKVACGDFSQDDRRQFAQLIGYSVGGYGDLSYASGDAGYDGAELGNSDAECIAAALRLARSSDDCASSGDLRSLMLDIESVLAASPAGLRFLADERARKPEYQAERERLIAVLVEVAEEDPKEAARMVDNYLVRSKAP